MGIEFRFEPGPILSRRLILAILLRSADFRRVVVSYERKYVHKVLVNRLVKLAKDKSVDRLTDRPNMIIAFDWDVKHQTKLNGW